MQTATAFRLLRAAVVSGLAGLVLATHTFVAIDRIRVKVIEAPVTATAGVVRTTTSVFPAPSELRPPFALIARVNSPADETAPFSIAVDGTPVCTRDVAGGGPRRIDCAVDGPWNPAIAHDVAIQGPASAWTLNYLELATHHGNTDGAHYLVVLPADSHRYVRPGTVWVIATWLLLAMATLFLPPPPEPWLRRLDGFLIGVVVVELAASQISQWIADYRVVLSAGTFARLVILAASPRLWVVCRRPLASFLRRIWWGIYEPGLDAFPTTSNVRWPTRVLVGLAMAAFGAVLLHTQLLHMDAVPDRGDPLFSVWRLGWVYQQLLGDPRPLFDANIYHPAPRTLTFSDSMLLPAVVNAPLLAAGIHPVTAYNILLLASFLASAFTCYLLVEALTGSAAAGFVSGLLFGFYPFRIEHYSHLELLMGFWIPLSLLALHRFAATLKIRYAVFAALMAVAQLYSSMYLAVLYLFVAAAVFGVLWAVTRPDLRRVAVGTTVACVVAVMLAAPLARAYTATHLPDRGAHEVATYSADLSDYLRADPRSAFWAGRTLADVKPERGLFPGLMILVLAAVALRPPLGVIRVAYAAALIVSVELTRGYNSLFYRGLYGTFSFMRGLRAPARANVLVGLALAVLAGFAVRRLLARRSRLWAGAIVAALTVLIGVDLYPRFPGGLESVWPEPPSIYRALGDKRDAVLAEFPLGLSPGAGMTDIPQMYFSLWHRHQIVNGYSGHAPADYRDFQLGMRSFPSESSLELLRGRGVTHVTVTCVQYAEGCDELLKKIGAVADLPLLASETWEGQPITLYALNP